MTNGSVANPSDATQVATRPSAPVSSAIATAQQFTDRMVVWQREHLNILTPSVTFSALPVQHVMIASRVEINPDPSFGEVYHDPLFCEPDEVAIAKNGLMKIAQAAGISTDTFRTDPRNIPNYWEFKAIGTWKGLDGVPMQQSATVEYDLRDTSARVKGFSPKRLNGARTNGARGAEARAINALIRQFGVKQKYKRTDVAKPFVVLRVAFQPDMTDPAQRMLVAQQAMAGTSALFAQHYQAPQFGGRDINSAATTFDTQAVPQTQDAPTPPVSDDPPNEFSVRAVSVEEKTWSKNGKSGKRFVMTFVNANGEQSTYSTLDETIAAAARAFIASKEWIDVTTERKGSYENLVDIQKAQPSMGDDRDDDGQDGKY